jgi:serine/threonine-protein kinase
MGEVYRARDPGLGRDLAIKVVRPCFRGNTPIERRFVREARVTGSLQHPDIVPVHNLGRLADGRLYYTMKLVQGQTLDQILADSRAGRPEQLPGLLSIFEKVCEAVAYAHSKRVIHRDLKPGNIMVGAFGEVQVMDWGLAKILPSTDCPPDSAPADEDGPTSLGAGPPSNGMDPLGPETTVVGREQHTPAEGSRGLSRTGMALGTPAFMPPEQAEGQLGLVDEHADVFALGAILCVLLTGRPPYDAPLAEDAGADGHDREEMLRRAQRADLADVLCRLDRCGVDAELVALCKECLAPRCEDRPRDAAVVAERLAAHRVGVQERLRQAELERAASEVQAREERKHRRLAVVLAATVLLLVVAGSAGLWWRQHRLASIELAVAQSLARARLLHHKAQTDPYDRHKYHEAEEAARGASELARASGASEASRQEADDLHHQIQEEKRQVAADQHFRLSVQDAPVPIIVPQDPRLDQMVVYPEKLTEVQLATAFREWGLDVDITPTTEAVRRLSSRPPAFVTEVVVALDRWTKLRRDQGAPRERWQKLTQLAQALDRDPSPRRRQLRQILERSRLPTERALCALAATLQVGPWLALPGRVVPIPVPVPLGEDHIRLCQLARETDPAREPVLGVVTLVHGLWLAGEYGLAERLLRAAIRARPDEVLLYTRLADILANQPAPRWRDTVECFTAVRALRKEQWVGLTVGLHASGRSSEARDLVYRVLADNPDDCYCQLDGATFLVKLGDRVGAIKAYERAIELDPRRIATLNNLGVVLHKSKDFEKAIALYQRAIALDSRVAMLHNNLGNALMDKGQLNEAIDALKKAINIDPKLAKAHSNLASALTNALKYQEAIAACKQAIALDPEFAPAHVNLGFILARQGNHQGALEAYHKALTLNPWLLEARFNYGEALRELHQPQKAIVVYQQVLEINPRFAVAYKCLATALMDLKRWDEAIAANRQAFALGFKTAEGYGQIGIALVQKNDMAGAGDAFQQAATLDPTQTWTHYNLAMARHRLNDLEEAVASYQAALRLDPQHGGAHGEIARALHALGRFAEGQEHARRCLELLPEKNLARPRMMAMHQECGRVLELAKNLPAILGGQETPSAREILLLARLCEYQKKRYAAARLYTAAFRMDPKLATSLGEGDRFRAAIDAVLAAAGQDEDAASRPAEEVIPLRRQALAWLRADLEASAQLLGQNDPGGQRLVQKRLTRWQSDPDLASVRDDQALAGLPEAERADWQKLWSEVAVLGHR